MLDLHHLVQLLPRLPSPFRRPRTLSCIALTLDLVIGPVGVLVMVLSTCGATSSGNGATERNKSQEITQSFESLTWWTRPSSPSLQVTEQPKEKKSHEHHTIL